MAPPLPSVDTQLISLNERSFELHRWQTSYILRSKYVCAMSTEPAHVRVGGTAYLGALVEASEHEVVVHRQRVSPLHQEESSPDERIMQKRFAPGTGMREGGASFSGVDRRGRNMIKRQRKCRSDDSSQYVREREPKLRRLDVAHRARSNISPADGE